LGTVLGSTRAKVLTALAEGPAEGHTTSSLATSLGISLASASSHATALRGVGLVTTRRAGRAVRHTLSDLGRRMVTAEPSAEPGSADLRLLGP
jgi:DNA-binding transcriptional ArsR family regulator